MILTGTEITRARASGDICIEPFESKLINPNSYNYRLGETLLIPRIENGRVHYKPFRIPNEGILLSQHTLYLGRTLEVLGSRTYTMSLIGRSSIGRLGLFLQVSANLGHVGSSHAWTLELVAAKAIRLYPRMRIGQVSFWDNLGTPAPYLLGYARFNEPTESKWSDGVPTD